VLPVPGPSAAVAALSVSGLPTDRFLFVGFLPPRAGARRRALSELAAVRETLVLYESPVRLAAALEDMESVLGDRESFLCREATKLHEEYVLSTIGALRRLVADRGQVKGEVVLVVAGASPAPAGTESVEALFDRLTGDGRSRREAVKEIAARLHLPARDVYARVLDRRAGGR
jgi:16S rRNA (cytidine1402-2'-O)-methyltransferase